MKLAEVDTRVDLDGRGVELSIKIAHDEIDCNSNDIIIVILINSSLVCSSAGGRKPIKTKSVPNIRL